jgi:DNA-directed RNA polymerase sigma subunit (sigma70/sigma32)
MTKFSHPDQESSRRIIGDQVKEILNDLPEKERKILELRHGFARWRAAYSRRSRQKIRRHSRTYSPN